MNARRWRALGYSALLVAALLGAVRLLTLILLAQATTADERETMIALSTLLGTLLGAPAGCACAVILITAWEDE